MIALDRGKWKMQLEQAKTQQWVVTPVTDYIYIANLCTGYSSLFYKHTVDIFAYTLFILLTFLGH